MNPMDDEAFDGHEDWFLAFEDLKIACPACLHEQDHEPSIMVYSGDDHPTPNYRCTRCDAVVSTELLTEWLAPALETLVLQ